MPMSPAAAPTLPPKPEAPEDGDCCGNDCERCVFTCYAEELRRWQQAVHALTTAGAANAGDSKP